MLELRYPPAHRIDEQHFTAVRKIIAEVLEAQAQRLGYRAGNQVIIDKIGLDARFVQREGYWREALDYHLGLLYARIGEPEKAADHFERSDTHPFHGGDQVFDDHQRESLELRRRQERARQRGMPSLMIAAMPRSASASLTQTLATMFDAPLMRISCGRFHFSGATLAEFVFTRRRRAARSFRRGTVQPQNVARGRRAPGLCSRSAIRDLPPLRRSI